MPSGKGVTAGGILVHRRIDLHFGSVGVKYCCICWVRSGRFRGFTCTKDVTNSPNNNQLSHGNEFYPALRQHEKDTVGHKKRRKEMTLAPVFQNPLRMFVRATSHGR